MTTKFLRRSTRILVLNPNSSASMTHGVEEAIRSLPLLPVRHEEFDSKSSTCYHRSRYQTEGIGLTCIAVDRDLHIYRTGRKPRQHQRRRRCLAQQRSRVQ